MTFAWQTFASLRLFTCLFTLARISCLLHFCVKTSRFPLLYLSHAQIINVNYLLPILFPDATAWFHMIATIATIAKKKKSSAVAAIIWKPLSSDRIDSDHWDRNFYISAIVVAAIATRQWKVVSFWSRRSLKFFFSAIVAIIWKPGLSYASLLNKIRFNNYNT